MDTIGDFLTRIRNAHGARHEKVDVPASNIDRVLLRFCRIKTILVTLKSLKTVNRELCVLPQVYR